MTPLVAALSAAGPLPLDELLDRLPEGVPGSTDDDVALLAVRVR